MLDELYALRDEILLELRKAKQKNDTAKMLLLLDIAFKIMHKLAKREYHKEQITRIVNEIESDILNRFYQELEEDEF